MSNAGNTLHFVGRLAEAPQAGQGNAPTKFRLIRNEFAGVDEGSNERKERVVSLPFVVFGARGKSLADLARKGDQLHVTARLENNRYTDSEQIERFDYNFVVTDYEFGAPGEQKRAELAAGR